MTKKRFITQFYAVEFCGNRLKGPYDTAADVMADKALATDYNAWPIAIFKLTLPTSATFQVDGYMTMRDDSELQPAL